MFIDKGIVTGMLFDTAGGKENGTSLSGEKLDNIHKSLKCIYIL